jgi:uncharacterized protein YdhG (YjbR/CyaY superfamily)
MKSDPKASADIPADIDAYIAGYPEEVRAILQKIRRTIIKEAPKATEMIKYRMPTFFLKENLVHFAAFKNHIGFYPSPSGITAFQKEIANYTWAKGSVQFPLDSPIPYDLIKRMVQYRVNEVMEEKPKKRKA